MSTRLRALEGRVRHERVGTRPTSSRRSREPGSPRHSPTPGRFDEPSGTPLKRSIIPSRCIGGSPLWASPTSVAGISRGQPGFQARPRPLTNVANRHRDTPNRRAARRRLRAGRACRRGAPADRGHRHGVPPWPKSRPAGAHSFLCAGTTYLSAGRIDEAASRAREALALIRRLGARGSEARPTRPLLAGDVALTPGAEER
jgi:hypothetical protein